MKYKFALLRFERDKNISDKVYWYVSEMDLKKGDKVLAPVGVHDRLQEAVVTETVETEPQDAPYDVSAVKSVMSRSGVRSFELDSVQLFEFGGARYDEKHYTPFGKILYTKFRPPFSGGLRFYGVVLFLPEDEAEPFEVLLRARGCVLLYGKRGEEIFHALLHLVRGEKDPLLESAHPETLARLKEKLL